MDSSKAKKKYPGTRGLDKKDNRMERKADKKCDCEDFSYFDVIDWESIPCTKTS